MNTNKVLSAITLYYNKPDSRELFVQRLYENINQNTDVVESKFMIDLIELDIIKTPKNQKVAKNAF